MKKTPLLRTEILSKNPRIP
uniref:Uncharacterized protein n=1 Tax=Romanomermis culicivorax TaxID=13658 RepID=A0A915I712_ROMCU